MENYKVQSIEKVVLYCFSRQLDVYKEVNRGKRHH
jgi:hypothetical protein